MKVPIEKGKTWSDRLSPIKSRLGSKKEPYIETEKEMLKDKKYTYSTLSMSERKMFNKLNQQKMGIDNEIFGHYREKLKKEILDRIVFEDWSKEDKSCEIWKDPYTDKKYKVEVKITRDWENMKEHV